MARVIQSLRRAIHLPQTLIHHSGSQIQSQSRNYISEMRKSAFDNNLLRLLRNEIQYELDRSPSPQKLLQVGGPRKQSPFQLEGPVSEFNEFKVDERPGEQWVRLEKLFGDKEEIKVEVTMFDGSVPILKPGGGKTGELGEELKLHITLIVSVFKEQYDQVLEFVCSAWPDSLEIEKVYIRVRAQMPQQPYMGPPFRELDDKLQDSLYEYLEVRGIDDSLCGFLHNCMNYKDKSEFIGWMRSVKCLIENQ